MATIVEQTEWVDSLTAASAIGVEPHHIRRLARRGLVGVRLIPGCRPAYKLADVEKVGRDAVRPATAQLPIHTKPG